MIVPRAYSAPPTHLNEKSGVPNRSSRPRNASRSGSPLRTSPSPSRATSAPTRDSRSNPVKIPGRTTNNAQSHVLRPTPATIQPLHTIDIKATKARTESAQDLLTATSIPIRRKPKGRPSQRLPRGDHVADFSRLLMDDVKHASDGSLPRSISSSHIEGLFGNIDGLVEGQMFVGSEGVDESVLTIRSTSSDSLASMASPDDYGSSGIASHRSSVGKSYQEKRSRQPVPSEDCAGDHPLVIAEESDELLPIDMPLSPPLRAVTPSTNRKASRSFKSSLTASLKAIKSAAHSVSKTGMLSASHSDDYLARSFLDIQPLMTDDKRPPPTSSLPSPELRRYLNPYTASAPPDSPVQLHFWHDDRHALAPKPKPKPKSRTKRKSSRHRAQSPPSIDELPPIVALATCLPPSVRTANASSPPIWLRPDGTPNNKHTANALMLDPHSSHESINAMTRSREPRENSDFLRIFVCEMEMRRRGKLNDDLNAGRARLWLPPMDVGSNKTRSQTAGAVDAESFEAAKHKHFLERWQGESINDL